MCLSSCPPQPASKDQVAAMLEKARAVMPAKPAAPAKSGGGKGSAEPSRAQSGGSRTNSVQHSGDRARVGVEPKQTFEQVYTDERYFNLTAFC